MMHAQANDDKLVSAATFPPGDPCHRKKDAGQLPVLITGLKQSCRNQVISVIRIVGELPWVGPGFAWNAANPYGIDGQHQPECARESLWSQAVMEICAVG